MSYDAWKCHSPDDDRDEIPEDACCRCNGRSVVWGGGCMDRCGDCNGTGRLDADHDDGCDPWETDPIEIDADAYMTALTEEAAQ